MKHYKTIDRIRQKTSDPVFAKGLRSRPWAMDETIDKLDSLKK